MEELQFDEEKHFYSLNGKRLLSVTQCLSILDDRRIDPFYLLRGTYIHKATELYDRDELDEDSVDPQIQGYFTAYLKFLADTGFMIKMIEYKLYHPQYLYAGKIDRIGFLNDDCILDLKSGAPAQVDELQEVGYWELCRANHIPIKKVFDLYLHADGTYKLEPLKKKPKLLLPVFLACLTATRWKEGI